MEKEDGKSNQMTSGISQRRRRVQTIGLCKYLYYQESSPQNSPQSSSCHCLYLVHYRLHCPQFIESLQTSADFRKLQTLLSSFSHLFFTLPSSLKTLPPLLTPFIFLTSFSLSPLFSHFEALQQQQQLRCSSSKHR